MALLAVSASSACSSDKRNSAGDSGATLDDGALTKEYDTLVSPGEFSFFAVSLRFIKSKAPCSGADGTTCLGGFGGDLRNGKSNGIDGADSLCEEAAMIANPGDRHRWRAFLSAGHYNGAVLNAIDRIGSGPWYSSPPKLQNKSSYASDGLLVASDKTGLLKMRPDGDSSTIVYTGINQSMGAGNAQSWPFSQCLLNEYGNCTQADGDTHDTLTGSKIDGTYAGTDASTCNDWTNSTTGSGAPAFGHTWPRQLNATDRAANWINTGETGEFACGAIINVSSTNYMDPGTTGIDNIFDAGMGPGGMGPFGMDDGGMGPASMGPFGMDDGGVGPGGMGPGGPGFGDMGDAGIGPGWPPIFTIDASSGGTSMGGNMGAPTGESIYQGGVGSGGGYGAFHCFAYIIGPE